VDHRNGYGFAGIADTECGYVGGHGIGEGTVRGRWGANLANEVRQSVKCGEAAYASWSLQVVAPVSIFLAAMMMYIKYIKRFKHPC